MNPAIVLMGISDRQQQAWARDLKAAPCLRDYALSAGDSMPDAAVAVTIIGDAPDDPLLAARQAHRCWPAAATLIVLPEAEVQACRSRLVTEPAVGSDTRIEAESSGQRIARRVAAMARRGSRRLQHREALTAWNRQLAVGPDFVPDSPLAVGELLELLPVGVVVLSANDQVQFVNQAARATAFGNPQQSGAAIWESWPATARAQARQVISQARSREGVVREVVALEAGEDAAIHVEMTALASRSRGRNGQVTVVLEDVSLREAASAAKSQFLANMAHELRTPLNAVLGFAQVLDRQAELADADQQALAGIQAAAEHVLSLFDNMLDLARGDAGRQELQIAEFSLGDLLDSLHAIFAMRCRDKGLEWKWHVSRDARVRIAGDGPRLKQILINLIENAIKFTVSGWVSLRVSRHRDAFEFVVEDSGPGIDEMERQRVMTPYYRGKAHSAGAGLGLAITKNLLDLMQAELQLDSSPQGGCRFHFEIELPVVVDEPATATFLPQAETALPPLPAELVERLQQATAIGAVSAIETIIQQEQKRLEPYIPQLNQFLRGYDFVAIDALVSRRFKPESGAGR